MWAIKIITGPQAGNIFQLKKGTYTLGRSSHVDIEIDSKSVSKMHAKILVTGDKLIVSDTQSSNGVFVNGVKIKNQVLKSGDKFSLSDIMFDVIDLPANVSLIPNVQPASDAPSLAASHDGNAVAAFDFDGPAAIQPSMSSDPNLEIAPGNDTHLSMIEKVDKYIDAVALPAVYKFSDKYDLKYVIAAFVSIFVILVTILTVLPVVQISRDFIVDESRRRTESLARQLVISNREAVLSNTEINVNVDSVLKEPGVDKAFVISASDGHIIAPLNKRGSYSKIPFLQAARKKGSRYHKVFGSQIGVSLPILNHNTVTGEPTAMAYSVVLYNMDKVALDFERALGLIIQILIITILAGGVLYFFLYRVILRPIHVLNGKVDSALRLGDPTIDIQSPTPIFQKLIANINSSLSRMGNTESDSGQLNLGDKQAEASELVQMFPVAALAYSKESEQIIAHNDYINGHPLFDEHMLEGKYIEDLSDPSMMESLKDLIQKTNDNPNIRHTNILPTQGGEKYEVTMKAILDAGECAYMIVSFTEIYDEEGFSE